MANKVGGGIASSLNRASERDSGTWPNIARTKTKRHQEKKNDGSYLELLYR